MKTTVLDDLKERQPYDWLRERDIELLLCSELYANVALQRKFADMWDRPGVVFEFARLSVTDNHGEADLMVVFQCNQQNLLLLLDNKIDTEFQHDHPESYQKRAEDWLKDESIFEAKTALLAPEQYMQVPGCDKFDVRLSYEEIISLVKSDTDPRAGFFVDSLRAAITKQQKGYSQIVTKQHDEPQNYDMTDTSQSVSNDTNTLDDINSEHVSHSRIISYIRNLDVPAEAKVILNDLLKATVKVGGQVYGIGRKVVEIAIILAATFPMITFALIVVTFINMLIAAIPLLGPVLASFIGPIVAAAGLAYGAYKDITNPELKETMDELVGAIKKAFPADSAPTPA